MSSSKLKLSAWAIAPFLVGILVGSAVTAIAATMRGSSVFNDVPAGAYYDGAIGRLYSAGIVKGVDASHYNPNAAVSRADVAVMIDRLRNEVEGITPDDASSTSSVSSSASSRSVFVPHSSSSRSSSVSSRSSSVSSSSSVTATAAGIVQVGTSSFSISETAASASVAVMRSGGSKGTVNVFYTLSGGTALAGKNYNYATGYITFVDGETIKSVSLKLLHNPAGEGVKTVLFTISQPSGGAVLGSQTVTTINILDAENGTTTSSSSSFASSTAPSAGAFEFSAATYGVQENGGSITVTVKRSGGSTGPVGVSYATSNGSAVAGTDYTAANGTLSFADGETAKTFTVTVNNDANIQGNRSINLTLSSPTGGAVLGYQKTAPLTIVDDETIPAGSGSFMFTTDSYGGYKDSDVLVTVKRLSGNTGTFTISYATSDGTAVAGVDYRSANGSLTFLQGETSKTFVVHLFPAAKTDRNIGLTLSSSISGLLGTPSSAILTIQ